MRKAPSAVPLLISALLPLLGGCGAEERAASPARMSFEEFEARTWREPGTGLYIVDGDTPVRTREELRAFYEELLHPASREGLAVYNLGGTDVKWDSATQRSLTYCVSLAFGGNHGAVVQAMAAAAADWEQSANVDFIYRGDQDGTCTSSNGNVLFDVVPASGTQYLAVAFFPNYSRPERNLFIYPGAFGNIAPLTLTGVLRHELGHVLGFRHEHIRPEAAPVGDCVENAYWRGLTSYDPASVMHYPGCKGTNTGDLGLTLLDRQGATSLYPVPSDSRADLVCNDATTAANRVAFSTGSGFTTGSPLLSNWCGADNTRILTGDVNGDGRDDLICNDAPGSNYVAFSTGTGFTVGGPLLNNWCAIANTRILTGDVNGDGRDDLVCNDAPGSNYVAFSTGSGFTIGGPLLTNWCAIANTRFLTGDVNGDGRDDLVCNDAGGSNYVAFSTGSGFSIGGPLLTHWCALTDTRILTGDVNGDGREDLVCNNHVSGSNYVAFSTGSGFSIGGPLLTGWCAGANTRFLAGKLN